MVKKNHHFRFPVFEDSLGAKQIDESSKQIDESKKEYSSEIKDQYQPQLQAKQSKHDLYLKNEALAAIKDNEEESYDALRERLKKQAQSFITSSRKSVFSKEEQEAEPTESKQESEGNNTVAEEYHSFANEPLTNVGNDEINSEVERIPLVKREMLHSKEQRQDNVPFHRKNKKKS